MKNKRSFWLFLVLFVFVQTVTFGQNKIVKGVISDVSGLPIPGVTVLIKGSSTGTSSEKPTYL